MGTFLQNQTLPYKPLGQLLVSSGIGIFLILASSESNDKNDRNVNEIIDTHQKSISEVPGHGCPDLVGCPDLGHECPDLALWLSGLAHPDLTLFTQQTWPVVCLLSVQGFEA